MQPFALACPTHDEHVALPRHEYQVVGIGAGRHALDRYAARCSRPQDERPPCAENDDRDQRLVEPAHLTIAVQTLEIIAVAIEDRSDAREGNAKSRSEVKVGLPEHRMGIVAHAGTESPLRHIPVVAEHLRLLPSERVMQSGQRCGRITDETRNHLDP
ncbi:MAG: hypothetical protein QOE09_113 [Ilumatobacteraceae bacterium]